MKKYVKASVGKYKEVYVVQEYTGYGRTGWEDVCTYDDTSSASRKAALQDVRDYMDNGFNARAITRKVENPEYVAPINELTVDAVLNYLNTECPYEVEEIRAGTNYRIKAVPGSSLGGCQVIVYPDEVSVYNIATGRSARVYTMHELVQKIDTLCGGNSTPSKKIKISNL